VVLVKEPHDEALGGGVLEVVRPVLRVLVLRMSIGHRARRELVHEDAHRVPVARHAVGLATVLGPSHLRRHVAIGAHTRAPLGLLLRDAGSEPHVDHPHVALLVDQQVLGLHVAVQDVLLVAVADDAHDLHHDEAHLLGRQTLLRENKLGEVSRGHEVHDQHEELCVLEGVREVDQEGVV
jgi:hypothetical protein